MALGDGKDDVTGLMSGLFDLVIYKNFISPKMVAMQ